MFNILKRALLAVAIAPIALTGFAWGQKGHDVTACIAERHLTPATKAAVDDILEGRSLVYWANWLDNASHTPEYAYTKTWHYRNVDADKTYFTQPKHPDGDVVEGIRFAIRVLSDSEQTPANKTLALKILTHLVGDLHQPMHMGHATDLGGNRVGVKYFGRDANLHSVWDTNLVESAHKWSYSEWADQLDRLTAEQQTVVLSGNVDDWAQRVVENATTIYNETPEGAKFSYDQVARWTPMIEDAFVMGGHRLAHILNSIFDQTYPWRRAATSF